MLLEYYVLLLEYNVLLLEYDFLLLEYNFLLLEYDFVILLLKYLGEGEQITITTTGLLGPAGSRQGQPRPVGHPPFWG